MDGIHDLGGMHGFGPVRAEPDEPIFHGDWERRVLAVTLATGALGRWSIDRSRFTREQLPPATYLNSSYYEIWLRALERLLVQSGLVSREDLPEPARSETGAAWEPTRAGADGSGEATPESAPVSTPASTPRSARDTEPARAVPWPTVRDSLEAGTPYTRAVDTAPAFAVGDRVRTAGHHPAGHTRLPRYARDKVGVIVAVRGAHVVAAANAVPAGTPAPGNGDWLYTVEFEGPTLWGADADPAGTVSIDAWQPNLTAEPAS